jgi:hypothetical protein
LPGYLRSNASAGNGDASRSSLGLQRHRRYLIRGAWPNTGEYTFTHNAIVTLAGREGAIVKRFSHDVAPGDLGRALHRLIGPGGMESDTRQFSANVDPVKMGQ